MREAGIETDIVQDLGPALQAMERGKYAALRSEVQRIDNALKTGGRYVTALNRARQGTETITTTGPAPAAQVAVGQGPITRQVTRALGAPMDIGDLQQLRSELRKRAEALEPVEAKQLLKDFQRDVDLAIDDALARQGEAAGLGANAAQVARKAYARYRSAEDMGDMIERAITSTPDLKINTFNLRQFIDTLRRDTTELAHQVNRSLDLTEGGRQRFLTEVLQIAKLYKTIEIPLTDVAGFRRLPIIAGLGQMLSAAMLTEAGRSIVRHSVLQGRGTLSPNAIALIADVVRRNIFPEAMPGPTTLQVAPGLLQPGAVPVPPGQVSGAR